MTKTGHAEHSEGEIAFQIAPMIDLILVLLIFFMCSVAVRQVETELGIRLPWDLKNAMAKDTVEMNIQIESDGTVTLNDLPLGDPRDKNLTKLQDQLRDQVDWFDHKIPVIITPDPDVIHARVIDVLNACVGAGIQNITFS